MEINDRISSFFMDSVRAHALRFERPLAPTFENAIGIHVLIAFVAVAVGVFYGLRFALIVIVPVIGAPSARLGFVVLLTFAFLATQRWLVRLPMADIGLRPLAAWTRRERLYLAQVVPMASIVFIFVFRDHLMVLIDLHGTVGFLLFSVGTGLLWGMIQEFLYRGWLQTDLTRRFGPLIGLLAANLIFTFGPLHMDYLTDPNGVRWAGLGAVFGIGLVFGYIYRRSGNLWFPAVLHGLWPLNMT